MSKPIIISTPCKSLQVQIQANRSHKESSFGMAQMDVSQQAQSQELWWWPYLNS